LPVLPSAARLDKNRADARLPRKAAKWGKAANRGSLEILAQVVSSKSLASIMRARLPNRAHAVILAVSPGSVDLPIIK
jgi:hypothetical protein